MYETSLNFQRGFVFKELYGFDSLSIMANPLTKTSIKLDIVLEN